jgi:hypothetical protein
MTPYLPTTYPGPWLVSTKGTGRPCRVLRLAWTEQGNPFVVVELVKRDGTRGCLSYFPPMWRSAVRTRREATPEEARGFDEQAGKWGR